MVALAWNAWRSTSPNTWRAKRLGNRDLSTFRRYIRIGAIAVLVVNLVAGLFARQQLRGMIDYALNVYDTAFISTQYMHAAELAFQQYVDQDLGGAASQGDRDAQADLEKVLDNLDVAIERAESEHSRNLIKDVRATIANLADRPAELKSRLGDIQEQMARLSSHAAGMGLKARDDVEAFSSKSDMLLWISIGSTLAMGIAALLLLERVIAQVQAARDEAERTETQIAADAKQRSLQREKELIEKSARAQQVSEALDGFAREMMGPTEQLHSAARELKDNAGALSEMAQQVKAQAGSVGEAAQETSHIVKSAAATGDRLAQSVAEVEVHANESSRLAANVVGDVLETSATIDQLAAVASEIDEVTNLISAIAGQTNLLALNATIEAARAGDAGRGFAVVAQEIKTLAKQTATATQDISKRIESIQTASHRAVEAIQGITQRIRELEGYAAGIASAVEQQTKAAHDIACSLSAASRNVVNVSGTIAEVEQVGDRTASAAGLLNSASISVADQAKLIHQQVRTFTEKLRTAQI